MSELWVNFKCPNTGINGVHKGRKVRKRKIFEEMS